MSVHAFDEPDRSALVAREDESKFFREGLPEDRARTTAGFNAYMGQRPDGGKRSRLADLRKSFGWSMFRSRKSAGGRAYRDALRARKADYFGFGKATMNREFMSDAEVADSYRTAKRAVKLGAGWRRFIPFSKARSDYKKARGQLRRGQFSFASVDHPGAGVQMNEFERLAGKGRAILEASKPDRPARLGDEVAEVNNILKGPEPEEVQPEGKPELEQNDEQSEFEEKGQAPAQSKDPKVPDNDSESNDDDEEYWNNAKAGGLIDEDVENLSQDDDPKTPNELQAFILRFKALQENP
jgi:hypothetical protein